MVWVKEEDEDAVDPGEITFVCLDLQLKFNLELIQFRIYNDFSESHVAKKQKRTTHIHTFYPAQEHLQD